MKYLIYSGIIFQTLSCLTMVGLYGATESVCTSSINPPRELCSHWGELAVVQGLLNLITDLYVLILPLGMVMRLQLTAKRKLGLATIFLAGIM